MSPPSKLGIRLAQVGSALRKPSPALVAAVIGCILGSFVLAVNAFAADWNIHQVPKGDLCVIEWNVRRALHAEQLIGMYSVYEWSHVGPAYFYWLSPFYRLVGMVHGIWIGAALLAAVSVALTPFAWCTLTSRPTLLLIWALPTFGVSFAIVTSQLDRFAWTPVVTVFPYLLLIAASLAVAVERWRWLGVALVVHSLLVQTHVAYVMAATATLGFGLVWGYAAHWRRERKLPKPSPVAAFAYGVALTALWLPVLVEVARPGTSNLARVFHFFLFERPPRGAFVPGAAGLLMQALSRPIEGLAQLVSFRPFSESVERLVVAAMASAVAGALFASVKLRSQKGALLTAMAMLQVCLSVVGVSAMRDRALDYLMFWMSAGAVVPWLASSYVLFETLGARAPRVTRGPLASLVSMSAVAVLAVIATVNARQLREPLGWHSDFSRDALQIADEVDRRLPRNSRVRVQGPDQERESLAILLRRRGHRPSIGTTAGAKLPQFVLRIDDEETSSAPVGLWRGKRVQLLELGGS